MLTYSHYALFRDTAAAAAATAAADDDDDDDEESELLRSDVDRRQIIHAGLTSRRRRRRIRHSPTQLTHCIARRAVSRLATSYFSDDGPVQQRHRIAAPCEKYAGRNMRGDEKRKDLEMMGRAQHSSPVHLRCCVANKPVDGVFCHVSFFSWPVAAGRVPIIDGSSAAEVASRAAEIGWEERLQNEPFLASRGR